MVVFALSIDDFVVTDYLSSNSSTQTVPIKIYSERARNDDARAERARDRDGRHDADRSRLWRLSSTASSTSRSVARKDRRCTTSRRSRYDGRAGRRHRSRRAAQGLRRRRRSRRHRPADRGGRVLLAARAVGLRQDDDAASDRRLRAARQRARSCSTASTWRRRRRTSARSTRSSRATRSSRTSTCSTTSPSGCAAGM